MKKRKYLPSLSKMADLLFLFDINNDNNRPSRRKNKYFRFHDTIFDFNFDDADFIERFRFDIASFSYLTELYSASPFCQTNLMDKKYTFHPSLQVKKTFVCIVNKTFENEKQSKRLHYGLLSEHLYITQMKIR